MKIKKAKYALELISHADACPNLRAEYIRMMQKRTIHEARSSLGNNVATVHSPDASQHDRPNAQSKKNAGEPQRHSHSLPKGSEPSQECIDVADHLSIHPIEIRIQNILSILH